MAGRGEEQWDHKTREGKMHNHEGEEEEGKKCDGDGRKKGKHGEREKQ